MNFKLKKIKKMEKIKWEKNKLQMKFVNSHTTA
jgi:hypothetical protein